MVASGLKNSMSDIITNTDIKKQLKSLAERLEESIFSGRGGTSDMFDALIHQSIIFKEVADEFIKINVGACYNTNSKSS